MKKWRGRKGREKEERMERMWCVCMCSETDRCAERNLGHLILSVDVVPVRVNSSRNRSMASKYCTNTVQCSAV